VTHLQSDLQHIFRKTPATINLEGVINEAANVVNGIELKTADDGVVISRVDLSLKVVLETQADVGAKVQIPFFQTGLGAFV
jgi:hypothetical protein